MKIILGFIAITAGFYVSLNHLDQKIYDFWDIIAFAMVVCGTVAVSVMTLPSLRVKYILGIIIRGMGNNHGLRDDCIANAMSMLEGSTPSVKANRIDRKIIVDGLELIRLGFSTEKIQDILSDRIDRYLEDNMSIAQWIRGLAKYPPAFGLAGTVLGLIHLMKGLSEGVDPKETGLRMAVALLATFYGLVVANIFINPIGDRVANNLKEDQNLAEIALNAVLMISDRTNLVEAVEVMNNYVPTQHKKVSAHYEGLEAS